ncbi:MAG: hypothetical protein WC976_09500, partial [Caldisericia bacterium]
APLSLLLSHPKDQQYSVIVQVHFLTSSRGHFRYIIDESMRALDNSEGCPIIRVDSSAMCRKRSFAAAV